MSTTTRDDVFSVWLQKWGLLAAGETITTRTGSRLLPVTRNGVAAMLKLADDQEERRGAKLMEWYGGLGAARVLAREGDALLLERLIGPRCLAEMSRNGEDEASTRIICRTAACLHSARSDPPPGSLIPLGVWFRALAPAADSQGGMFARSAIFAASLLHSQVDPVVLHGDLHHDNILDAGDRGWLAIDPKGLIGERAFDYANLFRNPDITVALNPGQIEQRIGIVAAESGLQIRRVLQWVVAYAGLGAAWSLQSGDDPKPGLKIAEAAAAQLGDSP